ncbi:MAG TPA: DUF5709 domain-containing protein [Streptosporangiaceae bacterium]|jgi:hypothetical protein|nr:DUF5709 domain-containing protein [Streptosporangiaceae bacterium]
MPEENQHESADLEDYEVEDASDTLDGQPGDDPLDAGVIPPQHWTSAIRYGTTGAEQEDGESLDQLLAEEEPDDNVDEDGDPADTAADPDAADEDLDGLLLDDGPDPRAGRLVAEDEDSDLDADGDLVAHDAGIDGGASTAEEAAMHVVESDDYDIRSE